MSRSHRKTPIHGACGGSDKEDKRRANQKFRHHVKKILTVDPMREELPNRRQLSNVWDMNKDGKVYFNVREQPESMRK